MESILQMKTIQTQNLVKDDKNKNETTEIKADASNKELNNNVKKPQRQVTMSEKRR